MGIDSRQADDHIVGEGTISLFASSEASTVVESLTITETVMGDTSGEALSEASTVATASGSGIVSGNGNDRIDNQGMVSADVQAQATTINPGVNVTVTMDGDVIGAMLIDSSAKSDAIAKGIAGDDGDDEILNTIYLICDELGLSFKQMFEKQHENDVVIPFRQPARL